MSDGRLSVFKTYKLYVGGKFPRSESGRVYEVTDPKGKWLANVPQSSRKDARDAVVAARKAFGGWSGATAYNRGQILYRIAEMLEGRREQFVREVADAEGLSKSKAAAVVDAAIDRWVWYAGWTDKIGQVVGGANPVAGPFFNLSTPEPTGVVAVLAPQSSSLLGLVSVLAPVIATGNTAVVVASADAPLPALSLGEVLATSDLPGGVVNILSGRTAELAAPLASHQDVNGIDLTGAAGDAELAKELEAAAAENLKRVLRPSVSRHRPEKEAKDAARPQAVDGADWSADPGTHRLTAFLETKTVWHPTGALGASGSSY
ncbi:MULTISPECIES: aldehyde dehydrogenase family protein [unclassified Streptomyces]|uniref:aldehyde dehydrogenase family protein n=1 Tax=unclassified Streptomyces TaxID=2593676 RepID=UPI000804833F|nr:MULTISPECIES: aldehyde dehydrogenase family protein [unclassified Streptomyces]MYR74791.1 aldehyde dehydrogenase family protein [Streptomyces sp. SID4925]SBU90307.1 NAD-dependent aldehyde dehydrogenases [Streptomyces sp. OspMP-M45]